MDWKHKSVEKLDNLEDKKQTLNFTCYLFFTGWRERGSAIRWAEAEDHDLESDLEESIDTLTGRSNKRTRRRVREKRAKSFGQSDGREDDGCGGS